MNNIVAWMNGNSCCNERWENAYNRFESAEEEIKKFRRRLLSFNAKSWSLESCIVDLFCGSGRNLTCLERLGFQNLHGVDLSPRLLEQYRGPAQLYVGDARQLHLQDNFADIVIVQGGLHHLPKLPDDLEMTLMEIRRVLKPGGYVVIVEPWLTPMLYMVHMLCRQSFIRRVWPRLDALAIMIEEEIDTYTNWLSSGEMILKLLDRAFVSRSLRFCYGKILFSGSPRS